MTDTSSHSSSSRKSGETIKDERARRKATTDGTAQLSRLTNPGTP